MSTDIKPTIHGFLARFFPGYQLKDDDDIFSLGFVNSLFALKLVMFLESEFKIQVAQEDLDIAHFRSVSAMDHFVERKRA